MRGESSLVYYEHLWFNARHAYLTQSHPVHPSAVLQYLHNIPSLLSASHLHGRISLLPMACSYGTHPASSFLILSRHLRHHNVWMLIIIHFRLASRIAGPSDPQKSELLVICWPCQSCARAPHTIIMCTKSEAFSTAGDSLA